MSWTNKEQSSSRAIAHLLGHKQRDTVNQHVKGVAADNNHDAVGVAGSRSRQQKLQNKTQAHALNHAAPRDLLLLDVIEHNAFL